MHDSFAVEMWYITASTNPEKDPSCVETARAVRAAERKQARTIEIHGSAARASYRRVERPAPRPPSLQPSKTVQKTVQGFANGQTVQKKTPRKFLAYKGLFSGAEEGRTPDLCIAKRGFTPPEEPL